MLSALPPTPVLEADGPTAARAAFALVFANERTFDAWYERALPRIYGYVFSRCGRDQELAEDLTQQTFLEVVRTHERFAGDADPLTWACGIARHKLADHFRQRDVEERSRLRLVENLPSEEEPDEEAAIAEREQIAAALVSLPALQRAVLVFTALDGLTCREVGELIGRTEGAVESLLHRARASFKRAYGLAEGRDDD